MMETGTGLLQLGQLAETSAKTGHHAYLQHHQSALLGSNILADAIDARSHTSHMSMDTSIAPHQSEGSQSTSSKTPEFSSHSPPVLLQHDIKQEPDAEMQLDDNLDYREGTAGYVNDSFLDASSHMEGIQKMEEDGPSPAKRRRLSSRAAQLQFTRMRSRVSITAAGLPREELARQSIDAALASRLNPYVLHPDEYKLLRNYLSRSHVTAYLNIRNRILRLWVRNPLVSVTPEEAAGCASEDKWLSLAQVAYDWLVRNGYINFGCVEVPDFTVITKRMPKLTRERRKIVVIGAGMSGLGCARQLEGLFNHYRQRFRTQGEEPPEVVILEGRARLGGRIYSFPLKNQETNGIPSEHRATAEMGAHIVTGFDNGNPMNTLVRGQLAIPYYPLKDNSKLYDIDGRIVDVKRDRMAERLFNDMLERASKYRHKVAKPKTVEGNREMIEAGRDPVDEGLLTMVVEDAQSHMNGNSVSPPRQQPSQVPVGVDKLTGKMHMAAGEPTAEPPVKKAEAIGFEVAIDQERPSELNLDQAVEAVKFPTLGYVLDEGVKQYQSFTQITSQDLRLLNWHFANLEYANAVNLGKLSLGGWDLDIGNEFEGEHAQVIGGYIQVPRGLWQVPNELDLQTRKVVTAINYSAEIDTGAGAAAARVHCMDGSSIDADMVVCTVPLGVLKSDMISFNPPLPEWKQQSIQRLGFGLLNKLVLVFDEPFWDVDRDMIGLLRDTPTPGSLNQDDYTTNRGRFYLFWNCIKTTGRPVLIALMAGDAAHQAEARTDGELLVEALQQLAKMFKKDQLPTPTETIVTRWGRDRFAKGTYSYVGAEAQSEDYDNMAKGVGNLYFAGEATCVTHPATVHGAYLSGLRAATDILQDLLGPIDIPEPLVPQIVAVEQHVNDSESAPIAFESGIMIAHAGAEGHDANRQARLQAFENDIIGKIVDKLGPRPDKPEKAGANPFLLFSKDKWAECKAQCDAQRQAIVGDPKAKASRNEVRAALGKMWREASEDVKRPYIQTTTENRATNKDAKTIFQERLEAWDADAIRIRKEFIVNNPGVLTAEEEADMWQALGVLAGQERKAKLASGLADD